MQHFHTLPQKTVQLGHQACPRGCCIPCNVVEHIHLFSVLAVVSYGWGMKVMSVRISIVCSRKRCSLATKPAMGAAASPAMW